MTLPGEPAPFPRFLGPEPDEPRKNHFPETRSGWIAEQIALGPEGEEELRRHVLTLYFYPLTIYVRRLARGLLEDPEDIVAEFLLWRLTRPNWLSAWEQSGLRLRRWLMNGAVYRVRELCALRRRHQRASLDHFLKPREQSPAPERSLEQEFARSIVQSALARAAKVCEAQGKARHWFVFYGHHWEERSFKALGAEIEVTEGQALVMARTASHRFKDAILTILLQDGADPRDVQDEVADLMRSLGS